MKMSDIKCSNMEKNNMYLLYDSPSTATQQAKR